MTSNNVDSIPPNTEFHAHKPGSEPLEKGGHKPGVLASDKDRAPEFHAQEVPAGSAPSDRTFKPAPAGEVPTEGSNASATIGGATSADVHTGLGHPGQGQTSTELHHDGQHGRKKQPLGKVGHGASDINDAKLVDERNPAFAGQRGLERDEAGPRDAHGGAPAEEQVPEDATTVAREAPRS